MGLETTYIQYGVPNIWAKIYASKEISVATFKSTSKKILVNQYQLDGDQVSFVKRCLQRQPIDENTVEELLYNNRYLCCMCRGEKSDSYIIHHIVNYSKTKDNSYSNLAVLCPNDHDLAHKQGKQLTKKITTDQIIKAKYKWENKVQEMDVQRACKEGEISEIDFVNPCRVLELYKNIFTAVPETEYSANLERQGVLTKTGEINLDYINKQNKYPDTPFFMGSPSIAWPLSTHFIDVFKQLIEKINFVDLDDVLIKAKFKKDIIGTYCYYVGGLYGKMPELPLANQTPPTYLYFHRRGFWAEWKVDPKFMISNTALHRLSEHMQYQIYGIIRNISLFEHKGKTYSRFDIRPYLFGMPSKTKMRTPDIHYRDQFEEIDDDYYLL